jgi:hypothetical protein
MTFPSFIEQAIESSVRPQSSITLVELACGSLLRPAAGSADSFTPDGAVITEQHRSQSTIDAGHEFVILSIVRVPA